MNLTFTFKKIDSSAIYFGDTMSYVIDNVTLNYMTSNPYFQNHMGKIVFV